MPSTFTTAKSACAFHAGVIEPVGKIVGYFDENTAGGPPSSVVATFFWAT